MSLEQPKKIERSNTEEKEMSKEEARENMLRASMDLENSTEKELESIFKEYGISPAENKDDVPNVMKNLRERILGKNYKRVLTAAAAFGMYFGPGLTQGNAKETGNVSIETSDKSENSLVGSDDVISYSEALNTEPLPQTIDLEDGSNMEQFKINLESKFDLGKAVQSEAEKNEIESFLAEEISKWPQKIQKGLEEGLYNLKVSAGCSPEQIVAPIDIGNGEKVDNNRDLSIKRMEFGEERVKHATESLGLKVKKIIKDTPFEDGVNPEKKERYVELFIEINHEMEPGYGNSKALENIPDGKIEKIYVDASESMKGKIVELYKNLEENGYVKENIKIQFGSGFNEVSEELETKSSRDAEIMDKQIRSKKKFSRNEETFKNSKLLLEKMPFVSDIEAQEGDKKIILLITDEYLKISEEEIEALEKEERRRNAKLVFSMQNQQTHEVTNLTLEDIKEKYSQKAQEGEELTLDVNSKKLENGKDVDIVI